MHCRNNIVNASRTVIHNLRKKPFVIDHKSNGKNANRMMGVLASIETEHFFAFA